MKKKYLVCIFLTLVITIVGLTGCMDRYNANMNVLDSDLTFKVNDVKNDKLRLFVQGNNNNITISRNIKIESIIVEGMENKIWISQTNKYLNENMTINIPENTNSRLFYYN